VAKTYHHIGNVNYDEGKTGEALKLYNKALNIYEEENKPSVDWANVYHSVGNVYQEEGKQKEAL
jgi:tetratricopeptide (TPR) repeat protein